MNRWFYLVFSVLLGPAWTGYAREALWIEGEDYSGSTFNQHAWYQNSNIAKDLLSPGRPGASKGEWHTHFSRADTAVTATYVATTTEPGPFTWWLRLNPFSNRNGGARYATSVDGAAFQALDLSQVASRIDLVDPGADIRFIGWVRAGQLNLQPGRHTLRIRLAKQPGDRENHGGIDVMALVNFPWAPSGVVPPNPSPSQPERDAWFPLHAGPDAFSARSIIDMSRLIEKPAGRHGPLTARGNDFFFADGTPIRFWGVGASILPSQTAQRAHARFLVKYGVNMVRLHPVENELGVLIQNRATGKRVLDPARLDRLDRWFALMKEQGIYLTWSLFYPHIITPDDGYPAGLYAELPDRKGGKSSSGLVAFMKPLQDAEWAWARTLLNHVNPYTGLAYKDDPALAVLEVHNEDSLFWHAPLNDLAAGGFPEHGAVLKRQWSQWLQRRYAGDDALAAAWGEGMRPGDSLTNPAMGIYGAWEMKPGGPAARKPQERKRMGDFIHFLADTQRDYYRRRGEQLRALGFRGIRVTTAWKAGGAAAQAANLWTDDALDAIDRHNYFGGGAGNHRITVGSVNNATHLDRPGRGILSMGLYQVEDKPFMMTEWTQKPPNQWKAEIAPLMAFYGMGLQGWDASYHFQSSRSSLGDGWPGMSSYVTATPHYIGQFPALAFAIYKRHFKEGGPAAARRLNPEAIFQGIDALNQDFPGGRYDDHQPNRSLATPTQTLAIGRVTLKIASGLPHSFAAHWPAWWDQTHHRVSSMTGQLTWDYGRRTVVVHSEKTQGVIGFAGGRRFDLPGLFVQVDTPFVSLIFTPLDNHDLKNSAHILVTALARDKQAGAQYSAGGSRLLKTGGPPLLLEPVQARISLKGRPPASVRAVDIYGVPSNQELPIDGNAFTIDGRYATYYYEIRRP